MYHDHDGCVVSNDAVEARVILKKHSTMSSKDDYKSPLTIILVTKRHFELPTPTPNMYAYQLNK